MPSSSVTANDFHVVNSTPEFITKLNTALNYVQTQDPSVITQLHEAADKGIWIMNNPSDNSLLGAHDRGQDLFGYSGDHPVAMWNPDGAMLIKNNGVVTGIESAASGLMHELLGHGLDPNQRENSEIPDSQYGNVSERVAVNLENVINTALGEPTRDSHNGDDVWVSDPTVHTITTEDGALQLVRMGADGKSEYGPQISYNSPGWNQLQNVFHGQDGQSSVGTTSQDTHASDISPSFFVDSIFASNNPNTSVDWLAPADGSAYMCKPDYSFNAYDQYVATSNADQSQVDTSTNTDPSMLGQGNQWDDYGSNNYDYWLSSATGEVTTNFQSGTDQDMITAALQNMEEASNSDSQYGNSNYVVDAGSSWSGGALWFGNVSATTSDPVHVVGTPVLDYSHMNYLSIM
jgi:hypothetical protein